MRRARTSIPRSSISRRPISTISRTTGYISITSSSTPPRAESPICIEDTRVSADFLLGSGLRADLELPPGQTNGYDGQDIPNGAHLPYYTEVNTGVSHVFDIPNAGTLTARFDVINVFDKIYEIRNGTGVGVGAPQFGARRGFFFGLSKSL